MNEQPDPIRELREAAQRRRELARLYKQRSEKLAEEARHMSLVATKIERRRSQG